MGRRGGDRLTCGLIDDNASMPPRSMQATRAVRACKATSGHCRRWPSTMACANFPVLRCAHRTTCHRTSSSLPGPAPVLVPGLCGSLLSACAVAWAPAEASNHSATNSNTTSSSATRRSSASSISARTAAGSLSNAARISGTARKGWKFCTTRTAVHSRTCRSGPSSVPGTWKRQYCSSNSGAVAGNSASIRRPMASKRPRMPKMSAIFSSSRALDAGASKASWFSEYTKSKASSKTAWQDSGKTSVRSLPRAGVPPSCSARTASLTWLSKNCEARARRKACSW
mmetsp:Transcript_84391/g.273252  ORF Transcript_84391/g.273252 Transcript_84391/m.273252 type:complete len:284 (-) Transcript_84391:304-1155(-)